MADEFTKAALYWIKTFNKKVKEKIWMEKLLSLLNEFETPQSWIVFKSYDDYDWTFYWVDCDLETEIALSDSFVCGKRFQWIKWLVENEKIEREKFWNSETKSSKYSDFELSYDTPREDYINILLMELAIQDEPIQFLIWMLR